MQLNENVPAIVLAVLIAGGSGLNLKATGSLEGTLALHEYRITQLEKDQEDGN